MLLWGKGPGFISRKHKAMKALCYVVINNYSDIADSELCKWRYKGVLKNAVSWPSRHDLEKAHGHIMLLKFK